MNKNEKAEIVSEIKELIKDSNAVYLIDYHGVNVEEISGLRKEFLKEGVKYKVFKNTLFKYALKEMDKYPEFENLFEGMIGVAITTDDNSVIPAKIIKKFHDEKEKFSLRGCYIESQFYGADKLNTLAAMPTKDEIMASIVGSLESPISGVVGAINAVMRDIVGLVDEISKQKAA